MLYYRIPLGLSYNYFYLLISFVLYMYIFFLLFPCDSFPIRTNKNWNKAKKLNNKQNVLCKQADNNTKREAKQTSNPVENTHWFVETTPKASKAKRHYTYV